MDAALLRSSLSSRSHEIPNKSSSPAAPTAAPRFSFRHRRRTKDAFQRPEHPRVSEAGAHSSKPWHRIRTRLSVMDDLAHLPAAAAACLSAQQREQDPVVSTDFSATVPSVNTSIASSAATKEKMNSARTRRMMTTAARKRRTARVLMPPPRPALQDRDFASVTEFLRSTTVPLGCTPESVDTSFKAHSQLLRKISLDPFDLNRYLFAYKPLAKVHAVLATALLSVVDIDQKNFPMSSGLRSAIMYIVGNSQGNVFVTTYAAQLKSIMRSKPSTEGILPAMVLEGHYMSDLEVAALDFAQEMCSGNVAVTEGTRRRVLDGSPESDGRLERLVAGTCSYGLFLSCLTSIIDIELAHPAVQYAANNLQCLPWKARGAPLNVGFLDDELTDFGLSNAPSGHSSKYRPRRERLSLTRNYDRHDRDRSGNGKARTTRGIRRVSQFFTASLMGPKTVTDANRATEGWMKAANVPAAGNLFDINDSIYSLYGFHPFYFSTAAMEGEAMRRAFLFGVKELLFAEKEISVRLKFIICYVLSSGKERRRILGSNHSKSFETPGVHNGHSITTVYSQRTYDALSIMSAHAAFLGCKYGATPAELVAASDASRVRSAMERYSQLRNPSWSSRSIGFPLTRRDCASLLVAHSLLQENPRILEKDMRAFERSFRSPGPNSEHSNRSSRSAFMEIVGAASMWSALERYATGTLAFDIDCTSNMVFGPGRAEPIISEFCAGDGRRIGLSLAVSEGRDVMRVRSDSKASRTSSLRPSMKSSKRVHRKRTSSALHSSSRVGRLFSSSNPDSVTKRASVAS